MMMLYGDYSHNHEYDEKIVILTTHMILLSPEIIMMMVMMMMKGGMAWPKKNKNAIFGPNLDFFGQKILIFTGEIKSFVTHITENPPRHLVHIVFWSGIGQNVKKMAIFGPK